MIEDGRWRTGDRLPSLRQIATSMGVSIATVVHAYTELERKGVIEARPRSGHYVGAAISALPTPAAREQALAGPRVVNRSRLISTVLEAVGNHELVPFGVLCPDTSLLPLKALVRIMGETMRSAPQVATGYETVQGNAELRRRIAWRMGECGMDVSAEGLVITTGAVEALYIAHLLLLPATARNAGAAGHRSPEFTREGHRPRGRTAHRGQAPRRMLHLLAQLQQPRRQPHP